MTKAIPPDPWTHPDPIERPPLDLRPVVMNVMDRARAVLSDMVVDNPSASLAPVVDVYDGLGDLEATVMAEEVDQDAALTALSVVARSFGGTYLTMVADTWVASDPTANPVTQQPWQHQEMQEVVEKHQGVERGWVREAIVASVIRRDGEHIVYAFQPYVRRQRKVDYAEPYYRYDVPDRAGTEGRVAEMIRHILLQPTIADHPEFISMRQLSGLDEHGARLYLRAMAVAMLADEGYRCALAIDNQGDAKIVERLLKRHGGPDLHTEWVATPGEDPS